MSHDKNLSVAISRDLEIYEKASKKLSRTISKVQKICKHSTVVELPFNANGYTNNPMRICTKCRFEEIGSIWSGGGLWSKHNYKDSKLSNPKFLITENNPSVFYSLRLNS